MFDIGWTELVVVGVVALIVIGPKELPGVLRMVGQWMGKVRRMAADFQGQFQEAMREAEMADLKNQVDDLADSARDLTSDFDPIGSMEDTIGDPFGDKPKASDKAESADRMAAADQEAIRSPTAAETAAQPELGPAREPSPVSEERESPHEQSEADTDEHPPPKKAAAGGHSG